MTERCGPREPRRLSGCPIHYALEIFGDRWTLLVLRDLLLLGKRHFGELATEEGIATNVLTERLRRLEAAGVLVSEHAPEDGRRVVYRPTAKARELVPVLLELAAWGARHDLETAAPPGFARRFASEREAVIEEYLAALDD